MREKQEQKRSESLFTVAAHLSVFSVATEGRCKPDISHALIRLAEDNMAEESGQCLSRLDSEMFYGTSTTKAEKNYA
jgi:hypothetical protein